MTKLLIMVFVLGVCSCKKPGCECVDPSKKCVETHPNETTWEYFCVDKDQSK
jgi:hypothetical protein